MWLAPLHLTRRPLHFSGGLSSFFLWSVSCTVKLTAFFLLFSTRTTLRRGQISVFLAAVSCSTTKHSRSALLPGVTTRPCYGYLAIKYFGKYEYQATLTRRIDGVQEYTRMPSESARTYF